MHTQSISFLDGWTELSGVGYMDYCCYRDSSSCEEPTEEITEQWYPFEGLLD